jgi:hypothetical protein
MPGATPFGPAVACYPKKAKYKNQDFFKSQNQLPYSQLQKPLQLM